MTQSERWLKLMLRVGGGVSCLALVAVCMPGAWMAWCHERLGLGPWPAGAIVDYLARSLSALYAIFGGLCIVISFDVRRHAGTITYLAVTHILFAAAMLVIDLGAHLPWYWTAAEVPMAAGFGVILLLLQAKVKAAAQP